MLYGNRKSHPYAARFGNTLAISLPYFVSVAITQGIVPLLFLQLVYGPMFYTSSILIAVPWLMIIFLLLSAYYAYYVYTYRREALGRRGIWVLFGAGLLFLTIAFIFSNNVTLMLTPERWIPMYQESPHGMNLNLSEPQLLPRYLHFVTAAVAVTGLTMGCYGLYWHSRERDYGQWLIRTGAALYLLVTLLQIPIGIWFLLSLGPNIYGQFLGGDVPATAIFVASMILDIISIILLTLAWREGKPRFFWAGLASALVVVFLMVVIRHLVRVFFIQGYVMPEQMPVDTQWGLILLFVGSFLIGIAYIGWLLRITWQAYPMKPEGEKV
jgi:hypothetical protein